MALIFAAAHGWNEGGSSGVALGSNCLRSAGLSVWPPAMPPNQTPERSGWPSAVRGAGPPSGTACCLDLAGCELFPSCAASPQAMYKNPITATTTGKEQL